MQIQVKVLNNYATPIACKVDGICLHNGDPETEQIEDEQGYLVWNEYCLGCGAYWNDLDDAWQMVLGGKVVNV